MTKHSPHPHKAAGQQSATGMSRFFSRKNLNRYRKLASGAIDVTERDRILKVLAEEIDAFKREGRASPSAGMRE